MGVEMVPFAGMIFSLLLALIIGGFVLMYPLTKRLGQLIELRMGERRLGADRTVGVEEMARLTEVVEALRVEVVALAERQEFTERLLESGGRSPAGSKAGVRSPGVAGEDG
jgi:hypothetical protein